MAHIPDFVPKEHETILRKWITAVFDRYGLNPTSLADEIQKWTGERRNQNQISKWKNEKNWEGAMWSRSTINRFVYPQKSTNHTSKDQMLGLWLYLSSEDSRYVDCFPHALHADTQPIPSFKSSDDLLSFALESFFCETEDVSHDHKLEKMKQRLPGQYVMYRLDMEPAMRDIGVRDTVRASLVEISATDKSLRIKETQDFPKTPEREAHYQVNNGVIIPYGRYMIAIMNSEQNASFKCVVIEKFVPASKKHKVDEFKGKILVASHLASVPSVKFVCKRIDGEEKKHGLYKYHEIDDDIMEMLKTSTFKAKYLVVS